MTHAVLAALTLLSVCTVDTIVALQLQGTYQVAQLYFPPHNLGEVVDVEPHETDYMSQTDGDEGDVSKSFVTLCVVPNPLTGECSCHKRSKTLSFAFEAEGGAAEYDAEDPGSMQSRSSGETHLVLCYGDEKPLRGGSRHTTFGGAFQRNIDATVEGGIECVVPNPVTKQCKCALNFAEESIQTLQRQPVPPGSKVPSLLRPTEIVFCVRSTANSILEQSSAGTSSYFGGVYREVMVNVTPTSHVTTTDDLSGVYEAPPDRQRLCVLENRHLTSTAGCKCPAGPSAVLAPSPMGDADCAREGGDNWKICPPKEHPYFVSLDAQRLQTITTICVPLHATPDRIVVGDDDDEGD